MKKGGKQKPVDAQREAFNASMANVEKKNPLEEKRTAYLTKLFDFYHPTDGKAIDLRSTPDGGMGTAFYTEAKANHDAGRVGTGLSYTDGASGGYNANFAKQLAEEKALDKDINAAGQLENYHTNLYNRTTAEVEGDVDRDFNRRTTIAGLRSDAYKTEANLQAQKDAKPKWWESLLNGGLQVAAAWAGKG